ncbi:uncharacterized protein LOC129984211 [Argiope bruennichi]|uniref:uncharacterized protein LOC129984211 n=1 Tax=Argiope bruennichi TaxID=94029 RepID=UPI002495831E|nr:uncharacterized protein LOC129984211 [Argiope bruennichi]
MSGNMYGDPGRQMHWLSPYETDNVSETASQYSDFGGYRRPRAPDLLQRLRKLYTDQLYTDVKFVVSCGIKPKPELRAHKAVLAIGSPEFAKMLFSNVPQDAGRPVISEYEIKNVPFEAFRNVVEYLYTDDVYFEDNALVVQTMAAAKKFQVQSLVNRCESYFESAEISEDNASSIYQMAIDNKMEGLKARCALFIQDNTRDVIRSDAFKNSTLSTVRTICKLPRLNLSSEEELFEAILEWADLQPGAKVSKRDILLPLLRTIHFLSISAMKFTQLVKRCPDIFTAEEAMHVVMHLANPNSATLAKLPTWFNKGPNRCVNKPLIERAPPRQPSTDRKLRISLRPFARGSLSSLMSILELKCLEGQYHIKALKLAFGDPVTEQSFIPHMVITVTCENNNYTFKEHIKIQNSKEVVVPFTKSIFMYASQKVQITAEANEVKNYKFLQFDEQNSFTERSPFECSLGSFPKENRLFFISEVIYRNLPRERPRRSRNFQRSKQNK